MMPGFATPARPQEEKNHTCEGEEPHGGKEGKVKGGLWSKRVGSKKNYLDLETGSCDRRHGKGTPGKDLGLKGEDTGSP